LGAAGRCQGAESGHRGGLDRRDVLKHPPGPGETVRVTRGARLLDESGDLRPEHRGLGEEISSPPHEVRARLVVEQFPALRQEVPVHVAEQRASGTGAFHRHGDDGEVAAGILDPVEPRPHARGGCADSSAAEVGDRRRQKSLGALGDGGNDG